MNSTPNDHRQLLNGLIEAADTLARIERGLQQTLNNASANPRSWWRRWFGGDKRSTPSSAAALESSLEGLRLGLQRLDRALERQGLVAVPAIGQLFDAETMQAVEAVEGTGQPHGTVIEEVRRGYHRNGAVFRFAQVKVAK
jgi:molecular chaperone GrpE